MVMIFCRRLLLLLILFSVVGCTARYRLVMQVSYEDQTSILKPAGTRFYPGAAAVPSPTETIIPGEGNLLVLSLPVPGARAGEAGVELLAFDQRLVARVYLPLGSAPGPGSMPLRQEESYLLLLGDYLMPEQERQFSPVDSRLVIDSLVGRKLFATIEARFINSNQQVIAITGQFRAPIGR